MTTTLLVDLNMADGTLLDVFLERDTYIEGSPAQPPASGEWVVVEAEGGIRCRALVQSVDALGLNAVLKLDMSTWTESMVDYNNPFESAENYRATDAFAKPAPC